MHCNEIKAQTQIYNITKIKETFGYFFKHCGEKLAQSLIYKITKIK